MVCVCGGGSATKLPRGLVTEFSLAPDGGRRGERGGGGGRGSRKVRSTERLGEGCVYSSPLVSERVGVQTVVSSCRWVLIFTDTGIPLF